MEYYGGKQQRKKEYMMGILFEDGWGCVQPVMQKATEILDESTDEKLTSQQYMDIYSKIYNMGCSQHGEQLYNKYVQHFDNYMQLKVIPCIVEKHDVYKLRELVLRWKITKDMARKLSHMFAYLDRYYVPQSKNKSLKTVGVSSFRDLAYMEVKGELMNVVITIIDKEREGEQIEKSLLKDVMNVIVEICAEKWDLYVNDFEKHILDGTSDYYRRKATKWIDEDDLSFPKYLVKAEECLKVERERERDYLHSTSGNKLIERVEQELLVNPSNQLFENEDSGCHALLRDIKMDDLSRLFRLYQNLTANLEYIAKVFKQFIIAKGTTLVEEAEEYNKCQTSSTKGASNQEPVLIRGFIQLYDQYIVYVNECFMQHTLFQKAFKEAFEVFCNKSVGGVSTAELLAIFCDYTLNVKRGGGETSMDETIEKDLEKAVNLIHFFHDKDLFAEFSRKKLARRLLQERSASEDNERSFLSKIKQQLGPQFSSKMEGMVTDLALSRDRQTKFDDYIHNCPEVNPGIDFTATVLTTVFWPSYKSFDLNLPLEMVKCLEAFKGFYETRTKRRKVTWIYSLGSCIINAKFESKTFDLVVTTSQAALLLLFNSSDRLCYSEIMNQLNLSHEDVVRLLHSLSCGRYKILNKHPKTQSISQTDVFEFNSKFTDKMRRIKIPLPLVEERKKIIENVDMDRRHSIDAAIVRIMKCKKVLGYQQLVSETVEYLSHSFKPDIKLIKKRIEDLITRSYLERDQENQNIFKYLA